MGGRSGRPQTRNRSLKSLAAMTDAHDANGDYKSDAAYTAALNALVANGWHDVKALQRQGDYVRATVQDFDGQQRSVLVDPRTGIVLPDMDAILGS